MHQWWLDERAFAGVEHLDEAYVRAYDRKAGFDPTDDVDALRALGLDVDAIVVDLGAGTGAFTVAISQFCGRVIAVDVSPAMTAALRRRVAELELDNVTVVEAGFLSYEHRDAPVDAVFTRNALHHLPDFWKTIALQRIAAVLRPDGILRLHDLVFDFLPPEAGDRIEAWLAGATADAAIGWTADELAEHIRTEFSTYSWLLDEMLDRAGFDVDERTFRRSVYGLYTCVKRAAETTRSVALKLGVRFSANAAMPSCRSLLANAAASSAAISAAPSSCQPLRLGDEVQRPLVAAHGQRRRGRDLARERERGAEGVVSTYCTRPRCSASSASTVRPASRKSRAAP